MRIFLINLQGEDIFFDEVLVLLQDLVERIQLVVIMLVLQVVVFEWVELVKSYIDFSLLEKFEYFFVKECTFEAWLSFLMFQTWFEKSLK